MRTQNTRCGIVVLIALSLLGTACNGEPVADTRSASPNDSSGVVEDVSSSPAAAAEAPVVETTAVPSTQYFPPTTSYPNLFVTHANGSQAWLQRIDINDERTEVEIQVVNGRGFDLTIRDRMTLTLADGTVHSFEPDEDLTVAEDGSSVITLQFPSLLAGQEPVSFEFNEGTRDADTDESAQGPRFRFDGLDVSTDTAPLVNPPAVGLADATTHPSDTTLEVLGLVSTESTIGVSITARNASGFGSRNLGGNSGDTYLEDDLGNRYMLADAVGGNDRLSVEENASLSGFLVFLGRMNPAASSVTLHINNDGNDSDPEFDSSPGFTMGPYAMTGGATSVSLPQAIAANELQDHPNDVVSFQVSTLAFEATQSTVSFRAENDYTREIGLNANDETFLLDDLGNRYPLVPLAGNEEFEIGADTGLDGVLTFAGRIAPEATQVTFFINDRGADGYTSSMRTFPSFQFGPYNLTPGEAVAISTPDTAAMGPVTSLSSEQLESGSVEEVTLVFDEFSGVEIPGGVRLTLPEGILFASGASELDRSADSSLTKIVKVMEYYAGDQVLILGHTDSQGSDESNQSLSEARAKAVLDALIRIGGDSSFLRSSGDGESNPVADNGTDEGRSQNRRVEIVISTDEGLPG